MKILVDENIPHAAEFFNHLGEVTTGPGRNFSNADLRATDVLIVRSITQVNQALLAGSRVRFVGTCTIGTDHLDIDYLNKQNIAWASAQGCNANSVVEYVFAALAKHRSNWQRLQIGIVGCGNVGGKLYQRLKQLGVQLAVYDPLLDQNQLPELTDLKNTLQSDILCLHTPLTTAGPFPTLGMIGSEQLQQLKPNAMLLSAGRGGVIVEAALLNQKQHHPDFTVVLDVWEDEPKISLPMMNAVDIATPHIAGYSYDGKAVGTEMIYQALCGFLAVAPQVKLKDVMATPEQILLTWPNNNSMAGLSEFLQEVYDIKADDQTMRKALLQAQRSGGDIGAEFDRLRKTYPVRREWHNYRLPPNLTAEQIKVLSVLGFKPVN